MSKKNGKFYIKIKEGKFIMRFAPSVGRAYRRGFRGGFFIVIGKELDWSRYF